MAGYTEEDYNAGKGGSTASSPSKGTQEWSQQNNGAASNRTPAKGSEEWSEQNNSSVSTAPASPTMTPSPTTQQGTQPQDPNLMGLDQRIEMLRKLVAQHEPETKEQREKRERKEKAKRIISAVGDGIAAMGNVYFATKGAPNMYNAENSTYKAVNAHLDKLKAEREANADKYRQFAMKLGDMINQRAATVREMEAEAEKRKIAQAQEARAIEAHKWQAALQDDAQREAKAKADKAQSDADTAQAEANASKEYYDNHAMVEREKVGTEQAKQNRYNRAPSSRKSSDKGPRTTVIYNPDGTVRGYSTSGPGLSDNYIGYDEDDEEVDIVNSKPATPANKRFEGFSIHKK